MIQILFLILLVLAPEIVSGRGLSPPNLQTQILVDTRVEDPPTYNGVSFAPRPATGSTIGIQVFVPAAAGKSAFSYLIDFGSTVDFNKYFTVQDAKSWIRFSLTQPDGQVTVKESQVDLKGPPGSSSRSIHFIAPPSVHWSGQIATITLLARETPPQGLQLNLDVNVAVYSTTYPIRILQMKGQAAVYLQ